MKITIPKKSTPKSEWEERIKKEMQPLEELRKVMIREDTQSEWREKFKNEFGIHFSQSEYLFVEEFISQEKVKSRNQAIDEAVETVIGEQKKYYASSDVARFMEVIKGSLLSLKKDK